MYFCSVAVVFLSCRSLWLQAFDLLTCCLAPVSTQPQRAALLSNNLMKRVKGQKLTGCHLSRFTVGACSCAAVLNVGLLSFIFRLLGCVINAFLVLNQIWFASWSVSSHETIQWVRNLKHAPTFQFLRACHFRVNCRLHNKQSSSGCSQFEWPQLPSLFLTVYVCVCACVFVVSTIYCWLTGRVQGLLTTCRDFLQ